MIASASSEIASASSAAGAGPRKSPPVIILKLDDVSQKYGTILPDFIKMAEALEARETARIERLLGSNRG